MNFDVIGQHESVIRNYLVPTVVESTNRGERAYDPVSYTHLTLPTTERV